MITTLAFRYMPEKHDEWTDEAIENLIGQSVEMTALGEESGRLHITAASRVNDEIGGIWISGEVIPGSRPFKDAKREALAHLVADAMVDEFPFIAGGPRESWLRAARGVILKTGLQPFTIDENPSASCYWIDSKGHSE